MSTTEQLYRLATRSFPSDFRADHGDEMVDTALELGGGSFSLREALSLMTAGVRTRARHGLAGDQARLGLSAVRIGLFLFFGASVADVAAARWSGVTELISWWQIALTAAMPILMLFTTGRIAALMNLIATVIGWGWVIANVGVGQAHLQFVAASLMIAAGYLWIGWRGDGRRVMPPLTGLALLGGAVVMTRLFDWWQAFEYFVYTPLPMLFLVVAAAAAISPFDPRLAAGTAIFLTLTAVWGVLTWSMNLDVAQQHDWDLVTPITVGGLLIAGLVMASRKGNRRLKNL